MIKKSRRTKKYILIKYIFFCIVLTYNQDIEAVVAQCSYACTYLVHIQAPSVAISQNKTPKLMTKYHILACITH